MESLWLLIPVSALLVLLIVAVFGWAINRGQFEDLDGEAERILQAEFPAQAPAQGTVPSPLDADQAPRPRRPEQS
jgi:cbb3-type cytochrome oxidase maturation protein